MRPKRSRDGEEPELQLPATSADPEPERLQLRGPRQVHEALENVARTIDLIIAALVSFRVVDLNVDLDAVQPLAPVPDTLLDSFEPRLSVMDDSDAASAPQPPPPRSWRLWPPPAAAEGLIVLCATQWALPPYRVRFFEAERILANVAAAAETLRICPSSDPELPFCRSRLANALADARLLGTSLFRTLAGRSRLRDHFRVLRESSRAEGSPVGARMVRAVVRALAESLLQPLPAPPDAPGLPGPGWTASDAEVLVDHCFALARGATWEAPSAPPDLFELEWADAERLARRADELSLPYAADVDRGCRQLRAKALCLRAFLWDQFWRGEEALDAACGALAELRRRQLAPGPLEAELLSRRAMLQLRLSDFAGGFAAAEEVYSAGETEEEALYSAYLQHRATAWAALLNNEGERGVRAADAVLEAAERLGEAGRLLLPSALQELSLGCELEGSWRRVIGVFRRNLASFEQLEDPSLPVHDMCAPYSFMKWISPRANLSATRVIIFLLPKGWEGRRVSPIVAHAHMYAAELLADAGRTAEAAQHLRAAVDEYETRFPHIYFDEHPRMRRLREAMSALRAPKASRPSRGLSRAPCRWRLSTPHAEEAEEAD
eukprot:tig00000889_g5315.t1